VVDFEIQIFLKENCWQERLAKSSDSIHLHKTVKSFVFMLDDLRIESLK